jgi:hypothetical protein
MLNPVDFSGRPFHFVGIGGIGMSAIAYILAKQGLRFLAQILVVIASLKNYRILASKSSKVITQTISI